MANIAAAVAMMLIFLTIAVWINLPESWNGFQTIGARIVLALAGAMFVATSLLRR
jgi:hypothetical protein